MKRLPPHFITRPLSPLLSYSFSLQKYRVDMPGSNSAFIPTINAITTSQDLQWMVQPTVITSMSNPYSRSHPYGHHLTNGPGLLGHNTLARPGVIRSIGDARGRRKRDEQVRDLGGQCGGQRAAKKKTHQGIFLFNREDLISLYGAAFCSKGCFTKEYEVSLF